jgi:hypothetical protein
LVEKRLFEEKSLMLTELELMAIGDGEVMETPSRMREMREFVIVMEWEFVEPVTVMVGARKTRGVPAHVAWVPSTVRLPWVRSQRMLCDRLSEGSGKRNISEVRSGRRGILRSGKKKIGWMMVVKEWDGRMNRNGRRSDQSLPDG